MLPGAPRESHDREPDLLTGTPALLEEVLRLVRLSGAVFMRTRLQFVG